LKKGNCGGWEYHELNKAGICSKSQDIEAFVHENLRYAGYKPEITDNSKNWKGECTF
jgi:hypothetical protein